MAAIEELNSISMSLYDELKRRFAYVLDSFDIKFIPIFLASTALHPSLRRYLSKDQRKVVIEHIDSTWEWIFHVIKLRFFYFINYSITIYKFLISGIVRPSGRKSSRSATSV